MKRTGKLIISFIWLVLAMLGIVSATFAWLSENQTVQAGGMEVKAETVKNLVISNAQNGNYSFSADTTITGITTMTPVSTVASLTNNALKFYTLTSTSKANDVTFSTGAISSTATLTEIAPTTTSPTTGTVYGAMKYTFYVKVSGEEGVELEDLYVSNIEIVRATNTSNQSNITKALRIGVVCGNKVVIYSVTGGQSSYYGINGTTGASTAAVTAQTTTTQTNDTTLMSTISTTPVAVDIYVWYEGQDTNCTSTNSLVAENLMVKVAFNTSDPE